MKLLGIVDYVNTCGCCGRTNLKCTVAFDTANGVVYYGRTCATLHYNRPAKEITSEIKGIKETARKEALAIWRMDTARTEYDNLLTTLNNGPRMPIAERLEIIRPVSAKAEARRLEVAKEVAGKYLLKLADVMPML